MKNTADKHVLLAGDTVGATVFAPLTQTDIVRYQGASGDFQPIHHDTAFAARAGMRQPLVIGMLPAGLVSGWLSERFGAHNVRYFRVRWHEPVWPGDVLSAVATVATIYADAEGKKMDVEVVCTRQNGDAVMSCAMTFLTV